MLGEPIRCQHSEVYPELSSVLERFVGGVRTALGDNFVGAYLVGSLALGDFDLDSDVDFLILINEELSAAGVERVQRNHRAIFDLGCYPAKHLEGFYIPRDFLRRDDVVGVETVWFVDNGSTSLERSVHDNQWHVRWILRERGIAMVGPDPKTLVAPVTAEALRGEAAAGIRELKSRFDAEVDRNNHLRC